jgi:aspartyl-tRNA(Asn)/glutamyl-tRNA(Gln) amidotransferase subunit A
MSIKELQKKYSSGETTATEVTANFIRRIHDTRYLNIFPEIFETSAMQLAAKADEKIKNGKAGKLAGVVIALKDNICYQNHKVGASSKILEGFTSLYSSTVVERLLAEDAIIIGRTSCDEFAMGSSNENSVYGPVLNPLDTSRVPGGSSGGSAAAVAAELCHAAIGTDTGGSIRQPASFTGTVGLKPTYGRVSRHGIIAYASSFDQAGPITSCVEDAALILEVIAGADEYDTTASRKPVEDYAGHLSNTKKYRIAVLRACIEHEGLNAEISTRIHQLMKQAEADGHQVNIVDFEYLDYLVPLYYLLTTAEASSNLSRYSGVHFGYRSSAAYDLESTYKKSRSEGFGKEVKRRIMLGTFVLSAGYYDAYYAKAQKARRILRDAIQKIYTEHDLILMPSTPHAAFPIGQKSGDPIAMYLEDIYTVLANITGCPAISVPCGTNSASLPFGLQLMAPAFGESDMLNMAAEFEKFNRQ